MLFTDCNFTLRDFRICIFRDIEKNSIGGISKKWTFPKHFRFLMCLLIEKKWKTSFPDWVLWLVKSVTWVNTFWSINLDNQFKKRITRVKSNKWNKKEKKRFSGWLSFVFTSKKGKTVTLWSFEGSVLRN